MKKRIKTAAKKPALDLLALFPDYDEEFWEGAILFDGFEEAFIGFTTQFSKEPVAVYDRDLCIMCLVKSGMTEDEAEEYFEFNTAGAWLGERTPMVFRKAAR